MFIMETEPKSIAAEAYRTLRTNIQYSSFDKKYKTILVTSSQTGEGKSTTAGNLALALAQMEKKVLLVDCDMRKPSLHKKFRISNTYGLSDLLLSNKSMDEAAHKYNKYLDIVTSGKIPPNPAEMIGSNVMSIFLEEMRNHFDYIILDTPPILPVTDAQVLSTKVDGIILVVRAGETKKNIITNSISLINKVNGHIIGTVLNGLENDDNKYYYYYGSEEEKVSSNKRFKKSKRRKEIAAF